MSCNTSCSVVSKYYVGDVGTEIIVDTCENITTATLVKLMVQKPDGTNHEWIGAVYDTTKIRYVVQAGNFDQAGTYLVQAYVQMPGWAGRGNNTSFKIYPVFS